MAEQYFTTANPAFIWTIDLRMSPFITIRGRDKFVDGRGEMQMKMNSIINLGTETGEKIDEGDWTWCNLEITDLSYNRARQEL
ncbi:MAG: hypothetical protein LC649_07450 [Bacteroidales bacterium]|nr:hypothetical protein [Bacteroidales bacterium]